MMARFGLRAGIRAKILLLAIIPVLSISVVLSWYYIGTQRALLTQDMQRFGMATAQYLAIAGQLAMYANDRNSLQQIARGPVSTNSVHNVAFFNTDGSRLLSISQAGDFSTPALLDDQLWLDNQHRDQLYWFFRAPVELEAGTMTDYGESAEDARQLLGWAVVVFSQEELYRAQRDNVQFGVVISMIVTFLVSIAAWLLSHSIYRPLRQALADREKALGAKDQFLARMSHELRTPLTTIQGFARRLERTPLSAEQSEYRHAIQYSSSLLLSLINDILDVSRFQYKGITLEELSFNLEEELEDVVSMHAYSAYEKSIELIMFIDSSVPEIVRGDAVRLKQIFNNLLANSVKFTDAGEIIVHVVAHSTDENASMWEVSDASDTLCLEIRVQDSGIGIPGQDMDKLFQPFVQADTSINRRFGGSGLGLVICQQLVELMGGKITIDSEVGKGTTVLFTVMLRHRGDIHNIPSLPQRSDAVAVVDHSHWSRRALRSQLTHWTRQVFALESTDRLIDLLAKTGQPFTAVLISLAPGATQEQALLDSLAGLRAHYQGPVILLTSMANVSEFFPERIVQSYPPVWCLSKPVRRKSLLDLLDAVSQEESKTIGTERTATAIGAPSAGCLKGIEILIAEDNLFNQKLFSTMLEAEEANTILADDGASAVERFQRSACTLVLMDAHMPGVDGIEACRQIISLAESAGRSITVIGLTADTLEGERERLLQAGASEVLYKPVDEGALFEALCRYAGRQYRPREGVSAFQGSTSKVDLEHELKQLTMGLRRALEAGQLIDSKETIHQLLGLSGMYGMNEFRLIVLELRDCLAQHRESEIQERLDALEALVGETVDQDGR